MDDTAKSCKHLHEALYLVPFELLNLPDPDVENGDEYVFRNPRILTEKGQADLFDKNKAAEIRDSIKEKTLLNPFIARWVVVEGIRRPQLIGGDRRYRAIDYLIKNKTIVKTIDGEEQPANELYERVMCKVYNADNDLDALELAYTENACRHNLTEGHDIAAVMELRKCNSSDDRICKVLNKQPKWLRDTDAMINKLDEKTLRDLIEDRLVREAALVLAEIPEVALRHQVLDAAKSDATEDYKRKIDRLHRQVINAIEEEEIAKGDMVVAEFQEDEEGKVDAANKIEVAKVKVSKAQEAEAATKVVAKTKNVRHGMKVVTGSVEGKCLREPKIRKFYLEPLVELLRNDGRGEDGHKYPTEDVKLSIKLIKGILGGEIKAMDILSEYYVDDDEEEEEIEDSSVEDESEIEDASESEDDDLEGDDDDE